jgi:hypothetical protein
MDCVAMCLKRKFQDKHWTLPYFCAKTPSTMMENLLLLLGELGEIAFRHALPFRKRDQEFKRTQICGLKLVSAAL